MKANKQKDIKVSKSGFNRSKFNWSHDINTTFTWGELQPTVCKMLIPGSNTHMQTQDLIRLAPMVAPTFGRVKYKTYSQFVGMQDIFPNWSAMMAQEPVTTGINTQIPSYIPRIKLGQLSTYVLHGARATIYWIDFNSSDPQAELLSGRYRTSYKRPTIVGYSVNTAAATALTALASSSAIMPSTDPYDSSTTALPNVHNRLCLFPALMKSAWDSMYANETDYSYIPLGNTYGGAGTSGTGLDSLLPWDRGISNSPDKPIPDQEREVTFDGADYVIEFTVDDNGTTRYFALALELSDLGKRLRKVLQGCGYQIDFSSVEVVSVLPLLAQYKAYFDIFGLTLYQNWETTYAAKFIKYTQVLFGYDIGLTGYQYPMMNTNMTSVFGSNNPQSRYFLQFMLHEVANEWYTDSADYVGAHIEKLAVSPDAEAGFGRFLSVDNNGIVTADYHLETNQGVLVNTGLSTGQVAVSADTNTNLDLTYPSAVHAFIKSVEHGEVDSELLKRMYKWTNRNTILGRTIEKLLIAQGLGKYVAECKSNFIGSTDTMVTISDVISTADTQQASGSGAVLGQYGGRGLQYNAADMLHFENDEYGYWITLATIVPEAGYTQGLDPTLTATEKFDFYHPDFDAVGMELTKKEVVVGARYLMQNDSSTNDTAIQTGFGFVPMYSKFKVAQNLVNGDFNRHNKRNVYLPYTLDKQLNINDYDNGYEDYQQAGSSGQSTVVCNLKRSVTTLDMPVAGNIWRMPTKYAWLGNFNRIFYESGLRDDSFVVNPDVTAMVGYSDYNDDNFLSHSICEMHSYAPMKPIEESYGLEEDDPMKGNGAMMLPKA